MSVYEAVLNFLQTFGFFDIIVPFLLVYSIVYGILYKTKLIGDLSSDERARSLAGLISFSIGLLVIGSFQVIKLMKSIIPFAIFSILVVFLIVMLISVTYLRTENTEFEIPGKIKIVITAVGLITFGILVANLLGLFNQVSSANFEISEEVVNTVVGLIVLLVMVGIAYFITKAPSEKRQEQQQNE